MKVIEQILGTYIPLCCISLPVLGFFGLVAALPVAYFALTGQGAREKEAGSRDQGAQSGE
jgi:hypothetical protein